MEQPNLSYIQSLSDGDKEFEEKLISIMKEEFPEEMKVYFEHINDKKYVNAAESVHKIKHKISILGLQNSYELANDFENNLKNDQIDLKDDFEKILQVITDFLETL